MSTKKTVTFSEKCTVHRMYTRQEYDRKTAGLTDTIYSYTMGFLGQSQTMDFFDSSTMGSTGHI